MAKNPWAETSDKDLIAYAAELHNSIYNFEVYGTKDLLRLESILGEIERRGYKIHEGRTLTIKNGGKKKCRA